MLYWNYFLANYPKIGLYIFFQMLSTFFTATKALEEFHHDYLKGYVMKIKLCPNEADETTELKNNNSFDSNDGESDTSENCRCRRYCNCQVDELESLENESDEGSVSTNDPPAPSGGGLERISPTQSPPDGARGLLVSTSERNREIEDSSAIEVDLEEG